VIFSSLSILDLSATFSVTHSRNIKVHTDEDPLAFELEVGNGELGGERHSGSLDNGSCVE